jgi:SAM-dependent methyltransferase
VTFAEGDIRSVRVGETFDAVVSLFHVMSYQTAQQDFETALATARAHLRPGGLFLFDAWYGPGVLTDPPSVRVKRASGPDFTVMRVAEPELRASESCVDVSFTVFVFSSPDEVARVVRETHRMRYWFRPEVAAAASRAGFEVVELSQWMTRSAPRTSTWNAFWVLRALP